MHPFLKTNLRICAPLPFFGKGCTPSLKLPTILLRTFKDADLRTMRQRIWSRCVGNVSKTRFVKFHLSWTTCDGLLIAFMVLLNSFSGRGAPLPKFFFRKGCTPSQEFFQEGVHPFLKKGSGAPLPKKREGCTPSQKGEVHPFPNFFSGRGAPLPFRDGGYPWKSNDELGFHVRSKALY